MQPQILAAEGCELYGCFRCASQFQSVLLVIIIGLLQLLQAHTSQAVAQAVSTSLMCAVPHSFTDGPCPLIRHACHQAKNLACAAVPPLTVTVICFRQAVPAQLVLRDTVRMSAAAVQCQSQSGGSRLVPSHLTNSVQQPSETTGATLPDLPPGPYYFQSSCSSTSWRCLSARAIEGAPHQRTTRSQS